MENQSTKSLGDEGEQIALKHLKQLGFEIVETNYRFGKRGEIDIIARDGDVLVFCEVKLRRNDEYGEPEFAVTPKKQAAVRKLARAYLFEQDIDEQECRFDVVAIRMRGNTADINYIPHAFT